MFLQLVQYIHRFIFNYFETNYVPLTTVACVKWLLIVKSLQSRSSLLKLVHWDISPGAVMLNRVEYPDALIMTCWQKTLCHATRSHWAWPVTGGLADYCITRCSINQIGILAHHWYERLSLGSVHIVHSLLIHRHDIKLFLHQRHYVAQITFVEYISIYQGMNIFFSFFISHQKIFMIS